LKAIHLFWFPGITCLFIAAKIEEIYPPKLPEFVYVTDGACSYEEIQSMELVVLKSLNWGLAPMTPNSWVKLYLQLNQATYIVQVE
jgi:cyclin E